MQTKSVKAENKGTLKAWIHVEADGFDQPLTYRIKYPRSAHPYYMVDGARCDLKPNEITALRKVMKEVGA